MNGELLCYINRQCNGGKNCHVKEVGSLMGGGGGGGGGRMVMLQRRPF